MDERRVNPKRVQKLSKKQVSNNGVGTKAQQALKLQHEEAKLERRRNNREKWKVEEQMKFKLRQKRKKEKKSTKVDNLLFKRQLANAVAFIL